MSVSSQDTMILPKIIERPSAPSTEKRSGAHTPWEVAGIAAILLLAAFLNFYQVTRAGLGNNYYAIGVKSMMLNWHNFLYASFDPTGFISIDKPPLALWMQVLSAKIFGFNSFALMLPEALAGVASVWLLYVIVRRAFGPAPALMSAGLLAISPVNVIVNRDNILESPLVLALLAATWAVLRATDDGNWKWLSIGAVLIGLGFNIKMLEAFLVVPALGLVYFCGTANKTWQRKLIHLYLAAMIMLAISFAWAGVVNLTPADQRPYIGSTATNSIVELIFAHNGLARYAPGSGPAPQAAGSDDGIWPLTLFNPTSPHQDQGYPGPLRLIQPELGGQAGWFIPLALLGLLSTIWQVHPRAWRQRGTWRALTPTEQQFVLWTVWFLVMAYFFSFAGHMNPYYLAILAPAVAAMAGIGLVGLWRDFGSRSWRGSLLIIASLASLAEQFIILRAYPPVNPGLAIYLLALSLATVVCLGLRWWLLRRRATEQTLVMPTVRGKASRSDIGRPFAPIAFGVTAALLCLAPILWTFASLRSINSGEFPLAGTGRGGNSLILAPHADPRLLAFLQQHPPHTFYLMGTLTVVPAEGLINDTLAPVMAFGGWGGSDQILTPETLATMLAQQRVRYFLLPSGNLTVAQVALFYPRVSTFTQFNDTSLTQWISQHCLPVPPEEWSASTTHATVMNPLQLYDCGSVQTTS